MIEIPDDISESNSALVKRGATEGPLAGMIPLFVDVETMVDENTSLSSMTLLQYLRKTHLTALGLCLGYEDAATIYYTQEAPGPPGCAMVTPELIAAISALLQRDDVVIVAHNAAFDVRVLHYLLGIPYPKNWWCSMEGAMGAWPELPDGFSLANLSRRLALPKDKRKLELDLRALRAVEVKCPIAVGKISNELIVDQIKRVLKVGGVPWDGMVVTREICAHVLGIYNARDVECMREVYVREIARIPGIEQGVGLRTNWQRRHHFLVDQVRLADFVDKMDENANYAEKELESLMGTEDLRAIFNRDNDAGQLTSVRYARLKKIVNDKIAHENFDTTSLKKIITKGRGAMLARNPEVAAVLTQTTRAGKMISHKRRATVFAGEERALIELGSWRAHTGRFSSPATGRGLNIHSVPKHDKAVAEPIRKMYRIPPDLCLVRGDLANVEYRVQGYLTKCPTVLDMFDVSRGGNLFTDPYSSSWKVMTGQVIDKKDPVRQVAKCLAKGTLVLTDHGKLPIEDVELHHRVFDGVDWVSHGGLTFSGLKDVVCVGGIWMTLDHLVLVGPDEWREAWELCVNTRYLKKAIDMARGCASATRSRSSIREATLCGSSGAGVTSLGTSEKWTPAAWLEASPKGAPEGISSDGTCMGTPKSYQMTSSESVGLTGIAPLCHGAMSPEAQRMTGMVGAVFGSQMYGMTGSSSLKTSSRWRTGTLTGLNSTVSITTETMRQGTSAWPPGQNRTGIKGRTIWSNTRVRPIVPGSSGSASAHATGVTRPLSASSARDLPRIRSLLTKRNVEVRTGVETYDVTDAGPGSRYACISQSGMLIVHNSATLGLGFSMGMAGYAKVLLGTLADAKSGITEELLAKIVQDNNWTMPRGDYLQKVRNELGCSQTVALSAYQIHKLFNEAHPEFRELANWLVGVVTDIATCEPGQPGRDRAKRLIDHAYLSERAPDRNIIDMLVDEDPLPKYPSLRIKCGPWVPTVCWREPHMRKLDFDDPNKPQRLTIRKAALNFKSFSPQLAVENVTQAAARNALCMGVERLEKMGYKDVIHIHDEVMLIVPRTRESVLAAREALLTVFGPGHTMPYGWSILIKPDEVTITESLYEDENDVAETIFDKITKTKVPGPDRWGRIRRNEPGCLLNLP